MDSSARFMAGFVAVQMLLLMALAVVGEANSSDKPVARQEVSTRMQKPTQVHVVNAPRTYSL